MNGGSLENGGSSQEMNEVEGDGKMSAKGEKVCVGFEEGASQESGKGEDRANGGAEGSVPKINTSKKERERVNTNSHFDKLHND